MDPLQKYGNADLFMTFVARMQLYSQANIEEIKDYLTQPSNFSNDDEGRALQACISQFLTQLAYICEAFNND